MFGPTTDVPALSLVIPVYDAADQLPATLQAVDHFVEQSSDRVEVPVETRHHVDHTRGRFAQERVEV